MVISLAYNVLLTGGIPDNYVDYIARLCYFSVLTSQHSSKGCCPQNDVLQNYELYQYRPLGFTSYIKYCHQPVMVNPVQAHYRSGLRFIFHATTEVYSTKLPLYFTKTDVLTSISAAAICNCFTHKTKDPAHSRLFCF